MTGKPNAGALPAAEEERDANCSQYPGVEELGQEEHGELHARILDMESSDKF